MTDQEMLNVFKPLVDFLAAVLGEESEVILQDFRKPDIPIIAIANAERHSGRKIGDPATELGYMFVEKNLPQTHDYLVNYAAHGEKGISKGSAYFIKNRGRVIGSLTIKTDLGEMAFLGKAIEKALKAYNLDSPVMDFADTPDVPVRSLVERMIADAIASSGQKPERMKKEEKIAALIRMKERGVLSTKGAAEEISRALGISRPTLYRYLKEAEQKGENNDGQ